MYVKIVLFKDLNMLELLNKPNYESISIVSSDVLYILQNLLKKHSNISVAEIGVGIGATSIEIAKWLSNTGYFHIYDYENRVVELKKDLGELGYSNVVVHGNTRKKYDGYYWKLAKQAIEVVNNKDEGLFDFVYLDGAHSFYQDAPAAYALKHLIKPGGYLLFDDYQWSFNTSPSMSPSVLPEVKEWYTDEQLKAPHIELVCSLYFDTDDKWELIEFEAPNPNGLRRLYKKLN